MAALEDVYVTLVITDSYLPGAAVLAHSLRDAGTQKKLAVMITTETLSADVITELRELYDYVIPVARIANPNPKNLYLMDRGDLLFTFTKINLWRQTQYRKIVYVDADIVALRAPDELFDIQAPFAAAPDIGWPDAFNSGVMVLTPNMGEYWALQTMAASGDSFDGADQGLLNQYFEHRPWQRISFTYNCTPNAEYQWEPAYRYYKANIKMVHFIGKQKPWTQGRHTKSNKGIYNELHGRWWAVYDRHLKTTQQYVPGQAFSAPSSVIRRYVAGEAYDIYGGTAQDEHIPPPPSTEVAPLLSKNQFPQHSQPEPTNETPAIRVEPPFTEPGERHENLDQGIEQPQSTRDQRRFSAPSMEWDATRSAPPAQSKPEAANFPQQLYSFSDDKKPYQPPQSFPEPPKDMYYDLPKTPTTPTMKPKAIFPWEKDEHRPKATRTFAEDQPPPPSLTLSPTDGPTKPISAARDFATEPDYEEPIFQPFAPQRNAWDDDKSIDRYVRAVMEAQTRRGKPGGGHDADEILDRSGAGRRESLILTDFPSYDDRPSLPVTPAPIRRSKFWGEERDEGGELPAAEGVPDQADWDPNQKLEQLRRNSVQELEHLKDGSPNTKISQRGMPEHASRLSSELEKIEESQHEDLGPANGGAVSVATTFAEQTQNATASGEPVFSEPDFAVPQPLRTRSPGSFSAESIRLAENLSPTER